MTQRGRKGRGSLEDILQFIDDDHDDVGCEKKS